MAYTALEKLINMRDGYRRVCRIQDEEYLLVQENGEHYLISRRCPHAHMPLDEATIIGRELTCPWHLIRFSLVNGESNNPACSSLKRLDIAYDGNTLGVDV